MRRNSTHARLYHTMASVLSWEKMRESLDETAERGVGHTSADSLAEMESVVGPIRQELYKTMMCTMLRDHHNNVVYARNIFFRQVFLHYLKGGAGLQALYRRPVSTARHVNRVDEHPRGDRDNFFKPIEVTLLSHLCSYLSIDDFYHFSVCDLGLSRLIDSETVWEQICRLRWTSIPRGYAPQYTWKRLAWKTVAFVCSFSCPECQSIESVIPILYGFPAAKLVQCMRQKRLHLGGDHIIDGAPAWMCLSCSFSWAKWPYANMSFVAIKNKTQHSVK